MGSIPKAGNNGANQFEPAPFAQPEGFTNGSSVANGQGIEGGRTDTASSMVPIAIVGMGLRLPGNVRSTEDFWDHLLSKKDLRVEIPKDRYDIDAFYHSDRPRTIKTRHGFFLDEDFTAVDPSICASMAQQPRGIMDPQQRLLLEVVWECMENAGQTGWRGRDIGVYVGTFGEDSLELSLKDPLSMDRTHVFGVNDFCLSNRVSYEYDLRGPSLTIKAACSASMVGLHEACHAVGSGVCSSAIVAGSSLILTPTMTTAMSENMVLSPDGECRTFDDDANGFARAEAVNAVYIKKLDDAIRDGDPIRAVIRSTMINSNGQNTKMAKPSAEMQEDLIRKAYRYAGIADIARTALFEAHGTGTQAGDAVETTAIARAFDGNGVYISAVKPNFGHSEGASGITSIIKAVLCLEKRLIPPNMRFNKPNSRIPFKEGKLRVPEELLPWPEDREERVSVNSFGIGGSNAHAILESARLHTGVTSGNGTRIELSPPKLLVLSALNPVSLKERTKLLTEYWKGGKAIAQDLAYTLASRREHERHRAFAVVAGEGMDLTTFQQGTAPTAPPSSVVFVFTGQGAQWHGMGKELIEAFHGFRDDIRSMDRALQSLPEPLTWTLEDKLSEGGEEILKAEYAQPLCAAIQIAMVNLLASWDIHPTAVIGHSSGEMAAAYTAKSMTMEQAIVVAYHRGQTTKHHAQTGGMAAIGMGRDSTLEFLEAGVVVACENSPKNVVISGEEDALARVLRRINDDQPNTYTKRLDVDVAYHSHMMIDVGKHLEGALEGHSQYGVPQIPMFSTVLGRAVLKSDVLDGTYWRKNLQSPVLFSTAVQEALKAMPKGPSCFIEIGPHCPLAGPLRQIFQQSTLEPTPQYVPTLNKDQNQAISILETAGQLFQKGMPINLSAVNTGSGHILTDLPPYPWDYSKRSWSESTVSKSWRLRKHAHHELLGSRVPESSDIEPMWRNILSLEDSSWLIDHKFAGDVVYPGVGHVSAVGEAIRQITGIDTGYEIRDLFIRHALVLEENRPVEVITTLRSERLTDVLDSEWYEFKVCSKSGGNWTKHCTGRVRASQVLEASDGSSAWPSLTRKVNSSKWYDYYKRMGLNYGPEFQGMSDITAHPTEHKAASTVHAGKNVPDVTAFAVHPSLLDSCLQLIGVAVTRGISRFLDKVLIPISIDSIFIAPCHGMDMCAQAAMVKDMHGRHLGDVSAFSNNRTLVDIRGVRTFEMLAEETIRQESVLCNAEWKPEIEFLPSLQGLLELQLEKVTDLRLMEEMTLFGIMKVYEVIKDMTPSEPHLIKHKNWMAARISDVESGCCPRLPHAQQWMTLERAEKVIIYESIHKEFTSRNSPHAAQHEFADTVFDRMVDVYEGTITALEVMLDDERWHKFLTGVTPAPFKPFLAQLGHSKPAMKVLEIGAGVGTLTKNILEGLHGPGGRRMYSDYVYTDITPAFFVGAKKEFSQYTNLLFKTLDITKDPIEQGFEAGAYDMIVCGNVLHATPLLQETLANVRKLLVPGGYLIQMELVADHYAFDAVLGLLPGWWLGEADGRADRPHISLDRWHDELLTAGFTGLEASTYDILPPYQSMGFMISRTSIKEPTDKHVALLHRGAMSESAKMVEQAFTAAGYETEWYTLESIPANQTVISLLELEEPFFDGISEETFLSFRELIKNTPKSVLWLTPDVQIHCKDPRYALTFGVARTMRVEFALHFATFEMSCCSQSTLQSLIKVHQKYQSMIDLGLEPDYEYSAQDDVVFTSRYYPMSPSIRQEAITAPPRITKKLAISTPGILDTLHWTQVETPLLKDGEIEVEVQIIGLNFKDMMMAMGFIGDTDDMGLEGVGIVRSVGPGSHHQEFQIGDRVSLFGCGLLRTMVVIKSTHCLRLPPYISSKDAATIPCVYSTVLYSLLDLGQLTKGQSVLIHSACGGVGLAAIQVSKMVGAEIFATVGSETKKEYLVESHGIPLDRIFNSRDTTFKEGVLSATDGRGVDVVLNSLSGEGLHASWECVAEFGKMVEIGKRDMLGRGKLDMTPFLANRSFFGVDLNQMFMYQPERLASIVRRTLDHIQRGELKPIQAQNIFEAQNIQGAFRKMQSGQHIGKILIKMPEDKDQIPASIFKRSVIFSSEATYLLVGGFGGLGIAIARWMVEKGARYLTFLSPSAGATPHSEDLVRDLQAMGCTVKLVKGSVANIDDVRAAIDLSHGRLAGVIQLAMKLSDQRFGDMSHDEWSSALAPKVEGTRNLYQLLGNQTLDFFVAFASIVGLCSNAGQTNYAAANSFLDSFVRSIRLAGFPASVIDLSGVVDIGYISQDEAIMKRYRNMAGSLLTEREVIQIVEASIIEAESVFANEDYNSGRIICGMRGMITKTQAAFRNDRRFATLNQEDSNSTESQNADTDNIIKWAASVDEDPQILLEPSCSDILLNELAFLIQTYSGEADPMDLGENAGDIGVDSLMAIEIHSWLKKYCRVKVPAVKLAKAKNVRGLTDLVILELKMKHNLVESVQS